MTPDSTAAPAETDVYVGRDYGRHDLVITPELIAAYAASVDDRSPLYTGPSPFGASVAPALIYHSEVYAYRAHPKAQPAWYLPNIYGNLHARQEWDLFAPVMVGEHIVTRSVIADRYAKRGREYVVNEIVYANGEGRVVARSRTHQSFLAETKSDGMVIDKSREKTAGRSFDVDASGALETIPSVQKEITLDMCWKFSGPQKNYHNDKESAVRLGFPDIVVQGMMSTCFLSEMMTERFGAGWIAGGKMNVNLVNIVWQSDVLTCRGIIREIVPEGARHRAHCEIWAEKADGTKVTIGSASAVVA